MTMLLILGAAMVLVSIYLVAAAIPSSSPAASTARWRCSRR